MGVFMQDVPQLKPKKLYRSRQDKIIAGVCGGLAKYFGTDATWIRLLFILLFFLFGSALLVYLILWIIVPIEPEN